MSETHETPAERRLREMGAARNTARILRRARMHVGCDEVRAGEDTACWQMRLDARCVSCQTTLVLSQALDELLAIERRARRSVNVIAERLARCEGEQMTTERVVAVFQHDRGSGRAPQFAAYTRDYNPAWEGCCLHRVEAASGLQAKAKAIAEHKARTNCRGSVFPTLTHRPEAAR